MMRDCWIISTHANSRRRIMFIISHKLQNKSYLWCLNSHIVESCAKYRTIWYMQCEGLTLQSAVAHLKVKCGKMLTSLSLPSKHQGHRCIYITVSRSISLSFSFTLWMVHLAYVTEWIHNPGQSKIPRGPAGIKWNHICRKDCCTALFRSFLFISSPFLWLTNTCCLSPRWLCSTRYIS